MVKRGVDAFLDLLASVQVRYIFGNPGSTELPLNDALVGDERFEYILGLQEVPVMAMADGYAPPWPRGNWESSICTSVAVWATLWGCSITLTARELPYS